MTDSRSYIVKTLLTCPVDGCCGCLNMVLNSNRTGTIYCNECSQGIAAVSLELIDEDYARAIGLNIK